MKNLYFDESGATGYNFLDPVQPIFAISSTDISPEEAEEILKCSFPKYAGDEFKFNNILKSSTHRTRLTDFAKIVLPQIERFFTYSIDKRYATLLKIIDFLIEPRVHSSGFSFYKNGYNIKYANHLYFGLSNMGSEDIYNNIIKSYQIFSRSPSKETLAQMIEEFKLIRKTCPFEVKPLVTQMIKGAEVLEEYIDLEDVKKTNDLHLTTMLAIVGRWRQMSEEDFTIFHDDTSIFNRNQEQWKSLTRPDVDPYVFPLSDGSTISFPLRVLDTISVDSKTNYSIQLCDIIAGCTTYYMKNDISSTPLTKEIQNAFNAGLGELVVDGIRIGYEFPEVLPPMLRGGDSVDYISGIMGRSK